MNNAVNLGMRDTLALRAEFLSKIYLHFDTQGVLPVRTPLLSAFGATDPSVSNMAVAAENGDAQGFLQTSPEFAMKRLLAQGSGDIYQICAAFRAGEEGRLHRPEFSMLEWYRLGFDISRLMDDVQNLIEKLTPNLSWRRTSCLELFQDHVGIDPHLASDDLLFTRANLSIKLGADDAHDRALMLDVIFSRQIQPSLAHGEALFVYDFPKEQAAYARIRDENPMVASRFELIIGGIEIANGYHEVTDAVEQARRHAGERKIRNRRAQLDMDVDPAFLASLSGPMPDCSGVAIGLDRLMMITFGQESLLEGEIL